MNKLDKLFYSIHKYGGQKMFNDGDIFVISDKHFCDTRNYWDEENNAYVVHPVVQEGNYIYYVCPFCSELHSIYKDEFKNNSKHNIGCCLNHKKSNKIGVKFPDGEIRFFKADKIILKRK